MKKLTKNNLLKLVGLKKEYEETKDSDILKAINDFITNVINRSDRYYSFLSSCNFDVFKFCPSLKRLPSKRL